MEIGWIQTQDLQYSGGNNYERMVFDALSRENKQEMINVTNNHKNKLLRRIKTYWKLLHLTGEKDLWIRKFESTVTLMFDKTKGKNLLLFHHLDSSSRDYPNLNRILEYFFNINLGKLDIIVTVSKYWENFFKLRGYSNIHTIYNAFDITKYNFSANDISTFKRQFGLEGLPIIYIGNCQRAKGVVEVYRQLKELNVHLVTSGDKRVDIPVKNLELEYRKYLELLKASDVVITMSKFKEGWCRTAHEAMLCKTPVIGSGLGGMKELLDGGRQIICKDFDKLKENVEYVMNHPEIGKRGYEYASQERFTIEHFEKDWIHLVEDIK